jgi:hypothetical protein
MPSASRAGNSLCGTVKEKTSGISILLSPYTRVFATRRNMVKQVTRASGFDYSSWFPFMVSAWAANQRALSRSVEENVIFSGTHQYKRTFGY